MGQQKNTAFQPALAALQKGIETHFYLNASGYYREHAEPARNKKPVSYLWPLCALIQAENELDALQQKSGGVDRIWTAMQKYYDDRKPAPGFASYPPEKGGGDRFYDDNQWIGIALMDGYKREKKEAWQEGAKGICRFMMTAYDTVSGGGLYWEEGKWTSKNTCSNGPGIILALQLYQSTGQHSYLDTALLLYKWVNLHLRDRNGLYIDNIAIPSGKPDLRRYSYNTGTMMQSNLYLYEITKDTGYLAEAKIIAAVAADYFLGTGRFRDGLWFNAVLLRAYQHLAGIDRNTVYLTKFAACVKNEIRDAQLANGLFVHKNQTVDLVNQAGMLEILARLSYLETQFQF
ncbi:MAG: glycoside hydrolase family 76 protein [Flavihumibacter sp.]